VGALGAALGLLTAGMSAAIYLTTMWLRRGWRRITGRVAPEPRPHELLSIV